MDASIRSDSTARGGGTCAAQLTPAQRSPHHAPTAARCRTQPLTHKGPPPHDKDHSPQEEGGALVVFWAHEEPQRGLRPDRQTHAAEKQHLQGPTGMRAWVGEGRGGDPCARRQARGATCREQHHGLAAPCAHGPASVQGGAALRCCCLPGSSRCPWQASCGRRRRARPVGGRGSQGL